LGSLLWDRNRNNVVKYAGIASDSGRARSLSAAIREVRD